MAERDVPTVARGGGLSAQFLGFERRQGAGINSQNFERDFDAYHAGGYSDDGCTEWTVETNCIVGGQGGHIFTLKDAVK